MKKAWMLFVLAMVTVVLAACGSEETRTFEMEDTGLTSTLTYTYSGDEVKSQTAENVLNYEELGIEKADAKEILKDRVVDIAKDISSKILGNAVNTDIIDKSQIKEQEQNG